jgi:hypothetical protein
MELHTVDDEEYTYIDPETDPDEDEVNDIRVQVDNVRDSTVEDVEDILPQTNSDQNQDLRMNETENVSETERVKEDTPSTEHKDEQKFPTTRSGRISHPSEKLMFTQAHHTCEEYSIENARVIVNGCVLYKCSSTSHL